MNVNRFAFDILHLFYNAVLSTQMSKDTILIIIPLSADKKSVPYIAQGPGNQTLREAKTISELPIAIRKAIASDCLDGANRQRRNVPSLYPSIGIFSQELLAQKRSVRDENAVEQSVSCRSQLLINYGLTIKKKKKTYKNIVD